jgi:GLPGLI family protein
MLKTNILFLVLVLSCNVLICQPNSYIGKIEYSTESILSSGVYKENQKTSTYFNDISYCIQQNQNPIDINAIVANQLKTIVQAYKKNNIAIDSFEIEKERKKLKLKMEESFKNITTLPLIFINYSNNLSTMPQKIGEGFYCVTDSLDKTNWILLEDTMTIESLFCQKARGLILGKFYEVWFAPSVPFAAGPSIMHGLPGIVVLAISEDKKRRYKLTKLEYPLSKSVEFTGCSNEKVVSRSEFLQLQEQNKKELLKKIEESKKSN